MTLETISTTEVDTSNYKMWIQLASAPEDFNMIVDKTTLTQMVHCFQQTMNQEIKRHFEEEFIKRQPMIDKAFTEKYNNSNQETFSINEELQKEKIKYSGLTKEFSELLRTQENLKNHLEELQRKINLLDQQIQATQIQQQQLANKFNLKIAAIDKEKIKKENELSRVMSQHDQLVEEFNKLQTAHHKYKAALFKAQNEVNALKSGLGK
ncbi:hypothetical protein EDI_141450 [Entamoeba dispar SAW760]|uniref:Uncharacterized protein n=1 Tax=Entamoeba dispar (strain ATCC PRA-260 / SAW760) TaxID=370354 RepID=B0EID6_ENTDS|nr:uncharacterized protein EDI_141450 [Entamoeba dispar SAW760]EDR25711.1 hypothetical protein EDI_141450 [Entamoeba dispar SAW760]|eukprot:EDR25711.1 hypothetical protein EDI_141450 [Entamoeba dispar SAW760]